LVLVDHRSDAVHGSLVSKDQLLAANEAFYDAFRRRDVAAMTDLWAWSHPVTCVHPSWDLLSGRDAVIASWLAILSDESSPNIRCERPRAEVIDDVGWVVCLEVIDQGVLIATNTFAREEGRWKMVHHHASAISRAPRTSVDPDEEDSFSGPIN
jgi:ketosteroid isomerase-like protein